MICRGLVAAILLALFANIAEARGACDGFNRCRCGVTAARYNNLPLNYNGFNLKRAVEWTRAFVRTSFSVGAVGYVRHGGPSGHVFTVVGGSSCDAATVHDDRGTYQRNVCHATFVSPGGGAGSAPAARIARRHRHQQVAVALPTPDRFAAQ